MNELLTLLDLCDLLRTDEPTALALWRDGHLPRPFIVAGRLVRWRTCDIEEWIDRRFAVGEKMTPAEFIAARNLMVEESLTAAANDCEPRGEFLGLAEDGWNEINSVEL